jgi:DNA-binding CsgD family transcriptional regulator
MPAIRAFVLSIGGVPDGEGLMERALALEDGIDEDLGEWSPSALAAECARHVGDVRGAIRHYEVVRDRATIRGDANVEQWAAYGLASAEILAGAFERASSLADLVLDIAEQTEVMQIPARTLRAHADAWLGRFESARTFIADSLARSRGADEGIHEFTGLAVLGVVEVCAGDPAAAAVAFREARAIAARLGLGHATVLRAQLDEVDAAVAAGELAQAEEAMAAFGAAVGEAPPSWAAPIRARASAAILAGRGDLEAATRELEHALVDDEALPPERGRALLALGSVLRRAREYRRSSEVTEQAIKLFERLGSPPWIEAARRELGRLPGRRPQTDGQLTNAEAAIAALVADGRSNKEVAAELVLTVKTVEVTLTRVYEKLGVRSRAELAARFRDAAAG